MAQTTPRMCKARKRVAHGHSSTEARGMSCGERAQRVGVRRRGLPTVVCWRPLPHEAGLPCPVVCRRTHGRESLIGTAVALSKRPADRRRRRCEEVQSPSRRLGGSPQAVSPERSASPDGACAGVEPEAMRRARQPLAGALEASPSGVYCGMLPQTLSPRATGTGGPLAEVAQRHQQSARDKARHPRERTDT